MPERIVMPDIESTLRDYFPTVLPDVQAFAGTTPKNLSGSSITAVRVGGSPRDLVTDVPMVTLHCRAAREGEAMTLARDAASWLGVAESLGTLGQAIFYELSVVSGPQVNPDASHPDLHRVSATYTLAVRGSVA